MTMIANSHLPTSGGGGLDTVPASPPTIWDVMGTVFGPSSGPQGAPEPAEAPGGAWPKDAWPDETTPQAQGAADLFGPSEYGIASMPPVSRDPAPILPRPDSCTPSRWDGPPWASEPPPAPCLPPAPSFPTTVQVGQGASGTVGGGFPFSDLFPDY